MASRIEILLARRALLLASQGKLIEAKASVADPFGDNALDWAARGKRKGVMEVLRRAGAAPQRPDWNDAK